MSKESHRESSDSVSVLQKPNATPISPQRRKLACKQRNCGKRFLTKGGLQLHSKTHYPEKFLLKCFECEFSTFQKGNLGKHLSSVHGKTLNGEFLTPDFPCSCCEERFLTETQLKSHLLRKHTAPAQKPFKCQLCEYTASEKSDLRKHIRIKHTGDRPYGCEYCEFKTHTASGIARHRRSHTNAKPFQCHICTVTFADKKRLSAHLMKHNDEKPFSCPSCNYSTNRKDNLKTHIRRNHMDSTGTSSYQIPSFVRITTEENPYSTV